MRDNAKRAERTLSVEEVADGHWMCAVGDIRRLEDLLDVRLRLDAHILLAKSLHLLLEVGVLLERCQRELHRRGISKLQMLIEPRRISSGADRNAPQGDLPAAPTKAPS